MRHPLIAKTCRVAAPACLGISVAVGCTAPWTNQPKPTELEKKGQAVREILNADDRPRLIHEMCGHVGLYPKLFQSFGLVTQLSGTGGDIRPSPQRDYILNEMRANDVSDPNKILSSKDTALVQVRTVASPGTFRGQKVDAIVNVSRECEASSLQGGVLLQARLHEHRELGGSMLHGAEKARVQGPIVFMPRGFVEKGQTRREKVDYTKGRILGGAKLLDTRIMGLRINNEVAHAMTSHALEKTINEQFHLFDGKKKRGVATAKDDGFVMLDLPTRYKDDPQHFLDAVLHMGFREREEERKSRAEVAKLALQEPTTARRAALQLETMGRDGVAALQTVLQHPNPEIRFYASYSLAYADSQTAVPTLEDLARKYPEFRKMAFIGLSIIDHYDARDSLERMLQDPEPEVRYGAIDALHRRDDSLSILSEIRLGDLVNLIEVPSATPLIAVSLEHKAEIAIFGSNPQLFVPEYFEVNPRLVIRPDAQGGLRVTRFARMDDRIQVVNPDLRSVLDAIKEVGGDYNDMVQFLDIAMERGMLPYPVAFNPRPVAGRVHERDAEKDLLNQNTNENDIVAADQPDISQSKDDIVKPKPWWDVRRFWDKPEAEAESN
ncbi:MAG: flagellar basal body P-ring protein FlgI [Pirellulales bacterium]